MGSWQQPLAQLEELLDGPGSPSPVRKADRGESLQLTWAARGADYGATSNTSAVLEEDVTTGVPLIRQQHHTYGTAASDSSDGSPHEQPMHPEAQLAGAVAQAVTDAIAHVMAKVDKNQTLAAEVDKLKATAAAQSRLLNHYSNTVLPRVAKDSTLETTPAAPTSSPTKAALLASAVKLPSASIRSLAGSTTDYESDGYATGTEYGGYTSRAQSIIGGALSPVRHLADDDDDRGAHISHNISVSSAAIAAALTGLVADRSQQQQQQQPAYPPRLRAQAQRSHSVSSLDSAHASGMSAHSQRQRHSPRRTRQPSNQSFAGEAATNSYSSSSSLSLGPAVVQLLTSLGYAHFIEGDAVDRLDELISSSATPQLSAAATAPLTVNTAAAVALAYHGQPDALCGELVAAATAARQATTQIGLLKKLLERLRNESTAAQGALADTVDNLRADVGDLSGQLAQARAECERARIDADRAKADAERHRTESEQARKTLEAATSETSALKARVAQLTSLNEQLNGEKDALAKRLKESQEQLEAVHAEKEEKRQRAAVSAASAATAVKARLSRASEASAFEFDNAMNLLAAGKDTHGSSESMSNSRTVVPPPRRTPPLPPPSVGSAASSVVGNGETLDLAADFKAIASAAVASGVFKSSAAESPPGASSFSPSGSSFPAPPSRLPMPLTGHASAAKYRTRPPPSSAVSPTSGADASSSYSPSGRDYFPAFAAAAGGFEGTSNIDYLRGGSVDQLFSPSQQQQRGVSTSPAVAAGAQRLSPYSTHGLRVSFASASTRIDQAAYDNYNTQQGQGQEPLDDEDAGMQLLSGPSARGRQVSAQSAAFSANPFSRGRGTSASAATAAAATGSSRAGSSQQGRLRSMSPRGTVGMPTRALPVTAVTSFTAGRGRSSSSVSYSSAPMAIAAPTPVAVNLLAAAKARAVPPPPPPPQEAAIRRLKEKAVERAEGSFVHKLLARKHQRAASGGSSVISGSTS